jgi:hypothetical protein
MITFHPAARKVSNGFVPMVTLRAAKGRMVGSKVAQNGNVFETAEEATAHAARAALRVANAHPGIMGISLAYTAALSI